MTSSTHVRSLRLKVLMHKFFAEGDHRQKALVILQKSWSTVLQLQQHIQKIFRLPGEIFLTVDDGCLLPTDEDIAVIAETDNVTVQPVSNNTSFHLLADAFSNAHIYSANETTPGAWTSDVSSPGISLGFAKKRLKKTIDTNIPAVGGKCKWSQDIDSLDVAAATRLEDADIEADSIPPKPKRQRKRKRKQAKAPTEQQKTVEIPAVVAEKPTFVLRAEPPKQKGHIRFGDDDSDGDEQVAPTKPPQNDPFPLPRTARVIRGVAATTHDPTTNRPITRQSSSNALLASPVAIVADRKNSAVASSVISTAVVAAVVEQPERDSLIPTTTTSATATTSTPAADALETMRQNVDGLNLPSVIAPLKEQDLIAFKIMKLSENYAPGLSEYIIGMVQSIDVDSDNVSVHIMAGLEQTHDPQGKFSLEMDEDDEDAVAQTEKMQPDRTYHVQRQDMFDVKCVQL